jgi:hypothetical protein
MREMAEPLKWYDPNGENTPWMTALYTTRKLATREGYCWQHVQTIMLCIDQYAESVTGNREYFWQKPHRTP